VKTAPFADEHVHLLAAAAARISIDLSPAAAPTIAAALEILRASDARADAPSWLRATGFDDALVAERRGPTTAELDAAVRGPVVVHHATGHAQYRNSAAGTETAPRLDLRQPLADFANEARSHGVVHFTDATATNGPDEFDYLRRAGLPQSLTVMMGATRLADAHDAGLTFGHQHGRCRVGHAKVSAPADDIANLVRAAHQQGWPVAVHVVGMEVLEATLAAFEASAPPDGTFDRIEHLSLSLPEHIERIALLHPRPLVVTQPSFLWHRRRKYRAALTELEQTWLYRVGSLRRAGIEVAFSSDAPVVPSRPQEWIDAAVKRHGFGSDEAVDASEAAHLSRLAPPNQR
jgi:predicted amidohydrolase YtcJ